MGRACASSKQDAASSRQPAPKRGQKLELPVGVPGPIFRVLLRSIERVCRLRGAFVGQFGPPTAPNGAEGLGDGRRWPCLGTESTEPRATCGAPFTRGVPVFTRSTVWSHLAPTQSQNGPKRGPIALVHAPLGVWWSGVSWDGIHLGNVRAAFWSWFAGSVIWPQNSHKRAPNGPKISPKCTVIAQGQTVGSPRQ